VDGTGFCMLMISFTLELATDVSRIMESLASSRACFRGDLTYLV